MSDAEQANEIMAAVLKVLPDLFDASKKRRYSPETGELMDVIPIDAKLLVGDPKVESVARSASWIPVTLREYVPEDQVWIAEANTEAVLRSAKLDIPELSGETEVNENQRWPVTPDQPGVPTEYKRSIQPVLVVDMDGTIRYNRRKPGDFLNIPQDCAVFSDVEDKLWEYRDAGWAIAAISNQGGVAHGYTTYDQVISLMAATIEQFSRDPFHAILHSPFDSTGFVEPFCHRSLTRKPDYGMLIGVEEKLFEKHNIVPLWDHSLIVGDRDEDQAMAMRADVPFMWAHEFFNRAADYHA